MSDHDWEERPRSENVEKQFDFPDHASFKLNMNFVLAESIQTLRVCRKCGVESINGAPAEDCDLRQVRLIMES